ncbi:MAG: Na+-driven multidrug efflux pump [uncultured Paraburkholderia sp.]|nr:MAG: Na+-driven multidrug efflux pump [uncultured Paraburkholderia sp.]CAH2925192.1 MAG: Na+-driven multidrug efflux pump [uncultured Paraburkholderia sp.]
MLGWLLGTQRVRLALLSQVFINSVNIVAVLLYMYAYFTGVWPASARPRLTPTRSASCSAQRSCGTAVHAACLH